MQKYLSLISILISLFITSNLIAQSLYVDSIAPAPNANYVNINANILIEFSQIVVDSTVNDSSIIIRGNQSGIFSAVYSGGGTSIITLNPDNDFRAGEIISVTITQRVRNEIGAAMSRGHTYSFIVACGESPLMPPVFAFRPVAGASIQGRDIKALDYNRDGYLDIITSTEGVPEQTYALQNDGNFDFCVINTGGSFRNVELHDFDGDGDYDYLGSNTNSSAIYWLENDGEGLPEQHTVVNTTVWTMTGGDIDSDGDIDILGAMLILNTTPIRHRLYWYENDGAGNFSAGNLITSKFKGGSESFFYIRDLDSDGAMDILAFHQHENDDEVPNTIVWYENNGSQGFSEHGIAAMPDQGRLTNADIDGDGDIDIVWVSTANSATTALAWFENNGSEVFTEHPITVSSTSRLYTVSATDLDGDNDLDILAGGYWFENDGLNEFNEHGLSGGLSNGTNYLANGISYGDMDNDGDMDVVFQGIYTSGWLENTNTMSITGTTPLHGSSSLTQDGNISISFSQSVSSASLANNEIRVHSETRGYLEGTLSGGGTSTITFDPIVNLLAGEKIKVTIDDQLKSTAFRSLPNSYGFSFQVRTTVPNTVDFVAQTIHTHTNNVSGMDIADMDGDGDMDLLSCSYTELLWYENEGGGSFTPHTIDSVGTYIGVFATDYNIDGYMDIYVDFSGNTANRIYINDGNENFSSEGLTSTFIKDLTDVNNDGDIDLVYFGTTNSYIYWIDRVCEGYSGFGSIRDLSSNDVKSGDLDNDGDTDFIAATSTGPLFYRNNDFFIYYEENIDNNNTTASRLADLDGDGDLDPIFIENGSALIWYENLLIPDSISFGDRQLIDGSNLDYDDLITVDIDGDGDQDIAAVSSYTDEVVWFENRLNEESNDFGPEQLVGTIANNPVKILTADLDGDGDPDIVTISENDDELNWFENTGGVVGIKVSKDIPFSYNLEQNYPNPFNPSTTISFTLPVSQKVEILVYNVLGQRVESLRNTVMEIGHNEISFNASHLTSGVYFYKIVAGNFVETKKMLLLK